MDLTNAEYWAAYRYNTYSQFGEDGILEEIFRRIGTTNKHCFEIGGADGKFMSNTRKLLDEGWAATLLEGDFKNYPSLDELSEKFPGKVKLVKQKVDLGGLGRALDSVGYPVMSDLGIIDIDGGDYYMWLSLVSHRPRVMVVEYDHLAHEDFVPDRDNPTKGCGLKALTVVAASRNYLLVAVTETNGIFVEHDLCHKLHEVPPPPGWTATNPVESPKIATAAPHTGLKINIGCGDYPVDGYQNWDRKNGHEAFPLDVADGSVDEIRASHVLEHFDYGKTVDVVKNWASKLKPGGCLKVAVPDFDKAIRMYSEGTDPNVEKYIVGGRMDADDQHGAIFNDGKLREIFHAAGLRQIQPWKSEIIDCASLPISLNLMGYKPKTINVSGVSSIMSMPRLCFTDQTVCMHELARSKIPVRLRQGVFWGQTMTVAITQSIDDDNPKYILTVDYDTLFSRTDVDDLYDIMEGHPEIDALCAMQMGRDRNVPLMTIRKSATHNQMEVERGDIEKTTIPISTGHFGLTMIRADKFKTLPKPWFVHKPDANGEWGDTRVDEDIYFWRNWEKAGFTLHQANHVIVGHMQLMVTWPDRNLGPIHQYVGDYRASGKPEGTFA